ncbi:GTP-binding protein lepa [Clavulina sp. PMI_390]|nr:GTP-binding protein lepa [Clavulina sp. PMI_390]
MSYWALNGCQLLKRQHQSNTLLANALSFRTSYALFWGSRQNSQPHFSQTFSRHYATRNAPSPDMQNYACESIRNFSIIAHIDHGKSTLADRLLELTGTITPSATGVNKQVLDKLKVERERGITVKAQTATMIHENNKGKYLLNLIDTPGHVDFAWEVSRSLAACQGALLLVDATQGVQAQSLSVFHVARERGLKIIPVLNKVDLPHAEPDRISAQMCSVFGLAEEDVIRVSAKTGLGVSKVLEAIIERIPPPQGSTSAPLKALLFDSSYDKYRGVVSLMSIMDGVLRKGDRLASCHTGKKYEVVDLGIMHPDEVSTTSLHPGQVGYVVCNMKESSEAHIGDTFHRMGEKVQPLPGFKPAQPMVYAGIFPVDTNDFLKLEESIKRLTLTDRSITIQRETSTALGQGCRLGFLGTLHMDVFRQRLEDEYNASIIITAPTVPFEVVYKDRTVMISNPTDFPEAHEEVGTLLEIREPMVNATIIVPQEYVGSMIELCTSRRAVSVEHRYLEVAGAAGVDAAPRVMITSKLPLAEIVTDFFDVLKHRTSGYASFDYEDAGYERCNMKKMTFLLNGKPVDALAMIVHKSVAHDIGKVWAKKLKDVIPRALFEIAIQAVVGNKVMARETLSAMRKDVTAGLYGGHHERKLKHLNRQKEGKKQLKRVGNIELPQAAFFDMLSTKAK